MFKVQISKISSNQLSINGLLKAPTHRSFGTLSQVFTDWSKPQKPYNYSFNQTEIHRLQQASGTISNIVQLKRLPKTAVEGDIIRLNTTNKNFKDLLLEFYFGRNTFLEPTGNCYLKFTNENDAIQYIFDVRKGGLVGGLKVSPHFITPRQYELNQTHALVGQVGGANLTCWVYDLPNKVNPQDIADWIERYQLPLAFDSSDLELAIKKVTLPLQSKFKVGEETSETQRRLQNVRPFHKGYLIRFASPTVAHRAVALLNNTPFQSKVPLRNAELDSRFMTRWQVMN